MQTNRSLLTFLLTNALALGLIFALVTGCKKDNDPGTGSTTTSLRGTWTITSLSVTPGVSVSGLVVTELVSALSLLEPNCVNNVTVTFSANGTVSNNAASVSGCATATQSQRLINTFFSSATTYIETDNQVTLTNNGQNTVASKTTTATTATLTTQLPVRPDNTPGQTTYVLQLTKR